MIKYRAFIRVVELESITKAAKDMGYSQPGVSHMLDALEAEIGFPLLIRNKDRIVPIKDGKIVLECCREIVRSEDSLQEMVQSISGLMVGNINIGSLNSMLINFVPKVTSRFLNAYSNITVKIEEDSFEMIQQKIQNGTVDIGFMSACNNKAIEFVPLFKDDVCLVMPKDHPFAAYEKIPVSALNGCDVIMPVSGWDDLVSIVFEKHRFSPNIRHYVASDAAGVAMAAENLGVYFMSMEQTVYLPDNVVIGTFEEDIHRTMGFGVRKSRSKSPVLQEFIQNVSYFTKNDERYSKLAEI